MLGGRVAIPARAAAQSPESIASKTPRQSFGALRVAAGGGWAMAGCIGAGWIALGAVEAGCVG